MSKVHDVSSDSVYTLLSEIDMVEPTLAKADMACHILVNVLQTDGNCQLNAQLMGLPVYPSNYMNFARKAIQAVADSQDVLTATSLSTSITSVDQAIKDVHTHINYAYGSLAQYQFGQAPAHMSKALEALAVARSAAIATHEALGHSDAGSGAAAAADSDPHAGAAAEDDSALHAVDHPVGLSGDTPECAVE